MLLTVTEVANRYNVTRQSVGQLIDAGKLPCTVIDGLRFINENDVPERWKHGKKGRWADARLKAEGLQDE